MNNSIHRISLDIHETASQVSIYAKKGDTARSLHITLQENGRPYRIAEGCSAVLTAHKPDGNPLVNDGTIEENSILYTFTDQTAAAVGVVRCEVVLYDSQNNRITSPRFDIVVEDRVYNDEEIISSHEANALISALAKAKDVYQKSENGEFDGEKGEKGDPGEPGYTPQKGVDYFTEADKAEIIGEANKHTDDKTTWKVISSRTVADDSGNITSTISEESFINPHDFKEIRYLVEVPIDADYSANALTLTIRMGAQTTNIIGNLQNVTGKAGNTLIASGTAQILTLGESKYIVGVAKRLTPSLGTGSRDTVASTTVAVWNVSEGDSRVFNMTLSGAKFLAGTKWIVEGR